MDNERLKRYVSKIEHIKERIEDIEIWLSEIDEIEKIDKKTNLAVFKAMQEIIEGSTDIIAMILKDEGKLPKDDYSNIEKISDLNILKNDFRGILKEACGFRNRLVHEYNGIDNTIALESINNLLDPMKKFIEAVKKWKKIIK